MTQLPYAEARPAVAAAESSRQLRLVALGVGARLSALGMDVLISILAAPFVLGLLAVAMRDLWPIGAIAVTTLYVAGSWVASGQTLGMHLLGVRLVDERTGQSPSLGQALMCTALTVPPLIGGAVLLNAALTPGATPLPDAALAVAAAAVVTGLVSTAFSFFDQGRMLHDRLCGLVVIRGGARPRKALARR